MSENVLNPKCRVSVHTAIDEWLDGITRKPLSCEDGEGYSIKIDAYDVHVGDDGVDFSFLVTRKERELL